MDTRHGGWEKRIMAMFIAAALLLTLVCLAGIFVEEVSDKGSGQRPVPVVTAAGIEEQPHIVSGFVPERHQGPPPPKQESFFLSWDFINGLFAVILLMEFVVFPFLFWLWFGKGRHTESK